jgi:hypothetical protein
MTLYERSKILRKIHGYLEEIPNMHLYRYSYFVDNSVHGVECKYALSTAKLEVKERKQLGEELTRLRNQINILLEEINGEG